MQSQLYEQIQGLNAFDASGWLGKTSDFPLMDEGSPELLKSVYANLNIKGALVSHWSGRNEASHEANRLLLDSLDGHDGFYTTLTLQPLFPTEAGMPGSPDWVWPKNARAARIFPASHKFSLVDWCVGSLCSMLIDRDMPLFVLHTETTFDAVYALSQRFPELSIVIESQTKKILYHMRMILPLLKDCPNVRLEISNCVAQGMIEYICENIGAQQLLFGTFVPACDPLVPLGMIAQASISEEEKRLIGGNNVRRLIGEAQL